MPNQEDYDPGLKYGNKLITNDLANASVTGVKMVGGINYISISKDLEPAPAATETSLFGTGGLSVAATLTGVVCGSLDSTAVNVFLNAGTASVGTVVLEGLKATQTATSTEALESVAVTAGTNMFLEISAAGAISATVTLETD